MSRDYLESKDLYQIAILSEPRFSSDGRWLAYVHTQPDQGGNEYKSAIWLAVVGGGRPRQFTNGAKQDSAHRWSPDGRWLAFVSTRGGEKAKPQIYLIPTDGGEARQLTEMENGVGEPAWSFDGKMEAFTSRVNAEEMAAEDKGEPEQPVDADELERLAAEKEKREERKADPRVIRRLAYRAETSYFDDRTAQLYMLEVDLETGDAANGPRRLTGDERNYSDPQCMPDGSAVVAVVSRKPDEDDLYYYDVLVRVPLEGGEPVIFTSSDTVDSGPRPSPDGQWIAYNSVPVEAITTANIEIRVIPAVGGEPKHRRDRLNRIVDWFDKYVMDSQTSE